MSYSLGEIQCMSTWKSVDHSAWVIAESQERVEQATENAVRVYAEPTSTDENRQTALTDYGLALDNLRSVIDERKSWFRSAQLLGCKAPIIDL